MKKLLFILLVTISFNASAQKITEYEAQWFNALKGYKFPGGGRVNKLVDDTSDMTALDKAIYTAKAIRELIAGSFVGGGGTIINNTDTSFKFGLKDTSMNAARSITTNNYYTKWKQGLGSVSIGAQTGLNGPNADGGHVIVDGPGARITINATGNDRTYSDILYRKNNTLYAAVGLDHGGTSLTPLHYYIDRRNGAGFALESDGSSDIYVDAPRAWGRITYLPGMDRKLIIGKGLVTSAPYNLENVGTSHFNGLATVGYNPNENDSTKTIASTEWVKRVLSSYTPGGGGGTFGGTDGAAIANRAFDWSAYGMNWSNMGSFFISSAGQNRFGIGSTETALRGPDGVNRLEVRDANIRLKIYSKYINWLETNMLLPSGYLINYNSDESASYGDRSVPDWKAVKDYVLANAGGGGGLPDGDYGDVEKSGSTIALKSGVVEAANVATNTLTIDKLHASVFDATPVSGSQKALTSGGAYAALAGKADATATATALGTKANQADVDAALAAKADAAATTAALNTKVDNVRDVIVSGMLHKQVLKNGTWTTYKTEEIGSGLVQTGSAYPWLYRINDSTYGFRSFRAVGATLDTITNVAEMRLVVTGGGGDPKPADSTYYSARERAVASGNKTVNTYGSFIVDPADGGNYFRGLPDAGTATNTVTLSNWVNGDKVFITFYKNPISDWYVKFPSNVYYAGKNLYGSSPNRSLEIGDGFSRYLLTKVNNTYVLDSLGGGFIQMNEPTGGTEKKKVITVDNAYVQGTHSNFAVPVSISGAWLKSISHGGEVASENGYDIQFYRNSDKTGKLDWETVKYDPVAGTYYGFVKMGVSDGADSIFRVFYGDAAVTTYQGSNASVWSLQEDVLHMEDNANSSTGLNNGTPSSTITYASGQSGKAATISGNRIDLGIYDNTGKAISFWFRPSAIGGYQGLVEQTNGSGQPSPYLVLMTPSGQINGYWGGPGAYENVLSTGISNNNWYHIVYGIGPNNEIFINGELASSSNVVGYSGVTGSTLTTIGNRTEGGAQATGLFDEVRIYKDNQSADWWKTEYNSIKFTSLFTTVASTEE